MVVMRALLDRGLATATRGRGNPTFSQRLVSRIPMMDQQARGSRSSSYGPSPVVRLRAGHSPRTLPPLRARQRSRQNYRALWKGGCRPSPPGRPGSCT
jgi:hypothetical protein